MLTEKEIKDIAEKYVKEIEEEAELELSIIQENTISKSYGMIFFYTSRKYYKTKDEKYNSLAGNAPFLVESKTGKVIDFGTGQPLEFYFQEYEEGRWPDNRRLI